VTELAMTRKTIAERGKQLDRELRRPFPSQPQVAPESKVWRREHGITDRAKSAPSVNKKGTSATSRPQWLESQ
jgi:hypothetical protein